MRLNLFMSQIINDRYVVNNNSEANDGVVTYQNPFKFLKPNIVETHELDPVTGHWYSGQTIPLRDPLVVKYGEYNESIELLNYAIYRLEVDIYFEYPTFAKGKHKIFTLSIDPLQHIIINTGIMDKDHETKLYVEVEDARYKKLQNMNICWNVQIPMTASYGASKVQTRTDVKNTLISITNLAYTMQSEEMKQVLVNFEKIVGRKFRILPEYKDDTGAGVNNYKDYPTNTPEEIMCLDLTKEEDLNRLLKVYGVGSEYYGGPQNRNTFKLGVVPNSAAAGAGVTFTWFPANFYRGLGHGHTVIVREQFMTPQQNNVLHNVFIHEMGHCLGFWHYNSMCYGEMIDDNPRIIETICNLLGSDLPYWEEMPKMNKVRVGGNDLERYIINNPDFLPKFYDILMGERDARNAELDRFNRTKSVTGLWFVDTPANEALLNSIHPVDRFTYNQSMNMNIFKEL